MFRATSVSVGGGTEVGVFAATSVSVGDGTEVGVFGATSVSVGDGAEPGLVGVTATAVGEPGSAPVGDWVGLGPVVAGCIVGAGLIVAVGEAVCLGCPAQALANVATMSARTIRRKANSYPSSVGSTTAITRQKDEMVLTLEVNARKDTCYSPPTI